MARPLPRARLRRAWESWDGSAGCDVLGWGEGSRERED